MSCKTDLGHWYGKIIVDDMVDINVDINETEIFNLYPEVLKGHMKEAVHRLELSRLFLFDLNL